MLECLAAVKMVLLVRSTIAVLTLCSVIAVKGADKQFTDFFSDCRRNSSDFDSCIKDALNDVRPFFKTGVPEYNLFPFDPFFAEEVPQKYSNLLFNYKLILRNVRESGWTISQVTRFKSDFNRHLIQYTQSFPDKSLYGEYDFELSVFGGRGTRNKGVFNLTLYDLIQTTTVTRKPHRSPFGELDFNVPLKVKVDVQEIKNLELHVTNLIGGRVLAERFLDWVINNMWQPGFLVFRPLINDLVSTAFTGIFNKAFPPDFPFDSFIK